MGYKQLIVISENEALELPDSLTAFRCGELPAVLDRINLPRNQPKNKKNFLLSPPFGSILFFGIDIDIAMTLIFSEDDKMFHLLLGIIYLAFISLGLPDSLLGSAWPVMYPEFGVPVSFAGIISMIISCGTIFSSLQSGQVPVRAQIFRCARMPPPVRGGLGAAARSSRPS